MKRVILLHTYVYSIQETSNTHLQSCKNNKIQQIELSEYIREIMLEQMGTLVSTNNLSWIHKLSEQKNNFIVPIKITSKMQQNIAAAL